MQINKGFTPRKKVLFLSDLDGTWLSKKPENRERIDREIFEIREEYGEKGIDLKFGYITARPPERVAKENLPESDWTVTFNGAKVEKGHAFPKGGAADGTPVKPNAWATLNRETKFSAEKAYENLDSLLATEEFENLAYKTVGQVVNNPAADANEFTTSLCFHTDSIKLTDAEKKDANQNGIPDLFETETFAPPQQIQDLAKALGGELQEQGVGHKVSPVYLFHGQPYAMFDVASPIANKGDAVTFLQGEESVTPEHTIVAGDGGNDISMMTGPNGIDEGRRSIVVGGDARLTAAASGLKNSIIQPASKDSALGVLEGLRNHLDAIVAG